MKKISVDEAWDALAILADSQPGDQYDGKDYFNVAVDAYKKAKETIARIRMYAGEGQWIPCGRCTGAAEKIVEMCDFGI